MITKFEIKNLSTSLSANFGQDIDCDFLYQDGGIDWSNVSADHSTYNYPNQVGSTISNSKLQNRDITIEAYVYYILSDSDKELYTTYEEQLQYAYNKIKEKKTFINNLINPQDYLRITIGNYYIEGKPSATPQYGINDNDNNIFFCRFLINIFCDNPMFKKITETETVMSGDNGAFHFPFILEPTGYVMGTRINYLVLVVLNEGNAKIGGKITLKAKAEIANPSIENIETGEVIKIHKTMFAGDEIIIDTSDGETRGIYGIENGEQKDYLQYWDFNNDWFKFGIGSNLIGYSTENQSETSLEVLININPEKFGLEDM